jgi:hypothetical protein
MANQLSLAVFKPARILDFVWEEEERAWNPQKLERMRALHSQLGLFEDNAWRETFQIIPKLPYSFSYRFEDSDGRSSEMQVLDWEAGALHWNCLRSADGDEPTALRKVRQKYFDGLAKTNLHFFLGTTQQFHFVAPNPWVIVGVFPIPHATLIRTFWLNASDDRCIASMLSMPAVSELTEARAAQSDGDIQSIQSPSGGGDLPPATGHTAAASARASLATVAGRPKSSSPSAPRL